MNEQSVQSHKLAQEVDRVEIVYYTDPLCCWSWAFEPQWRKLRYEFSGKIAWQYKMGGLIADWNHFQDPMNSISRPAQMGPLWMEAKHISGMPINDRIWLTDPPSSSYPACIAVKCAQIQSPQAGEAYLRKLREAVMLHGRNIAKREVLLEVAQELAAPSPQILDAKQFEQALVQNTGLDAFREDLQQIRYHAISRFPTLTIRRPKGQGVLIVGYRPYQALLTALKQVAPDIQPVQKASHADTYTSYWDGAIEKEINEALYF
jgi:putative protein-disulfide isomerase